MLFRISHSECPCISFQTPTQAENPFLRVHALLWQWQYSGQAVKTDLHHLLMVQMDTKWTLISQFPGQSLDPTPLDSDFFGCWGEPQPQIPTSPILQGWNLGLHRSALKTYCKKIKKLLNSSFYKYHKSFKRRQYVGMEAVLASGGLW